MIKISTPDILNKTNIYPNFHLFVNKILLDNLFNKIKNENYGIFGLEYYPISNNSNVYQLGISGTIENLLDNPVDTVKKELIEELCLDININNISLEYKTTKNRYLYYTYFLDYDNTTIQTNLEFESSTNKNIGKIYAFLFFKMENTNEIIHLYHTNEYQFGEKNIKSIILYRGVDIKHYLTTMYYKKKCNCSNCINT